MTPMRTLLRLTASVAALFGVLVAGCSDSPTTVSPTTADSVATTESAATTVSAATPASTATTVAAMPSLPMITSAGGAPTIATTTLAPSASPPSAPPTSATASAVPAATATPSTPSTLPAELPTPAPPPADPNGSEGKLQVGSIEIPKINISKPMFEGVTLTTLDRGPGHWPGTAMPGDVGNVVIGGHRVSHDKPFRNIDKLDVGDDVFFTTDAGRFDYKVVSTEIVTPDAIRIVDQTPERTATLFACTPPGSTKYRIVIHLALSEEPVPVAP
jgi:sortase A